MKPALSLLLILFSFKGFSQTVEKALKSSDQLVSEKKYESAFKLLEKIDTNNNNADVVIAKENIVLGYFVTSIMHITFSLKDLQPNENIDDYRGKAGSSTAHIFPVDSLLNRLIKNEPDNYKLYIALGNYYYEVFLNYNANWVKNSETLFKLIEENYTRAIALHAVDYMTYYELGYIEDIQKKYAQATNYFQKSIELNNSYANSFYNLALAYLYQDDRSNAVIYAVKSLDLYHDKSYKGDAARMAGEIYGELKDTVKEVYYYELSDKIDPENYDTLNALLNSYVQTRNLKETPTLNTFYMLAPENPAIYNELANIYDAKPAGLIKFYESKLPNYTNNDKVYGSLCFYLAQLYVDTDNKSLFKFYSIIIL